MRVKRDLELLYCRENDPWNIGDADYGRYNLYYDLILSYAESDKKILDIGCGFGSFLARFRDYFKELYGYELSSEAILKGQGKFPFIKYTKGRVENIGEILPGSRFYDVIIYSDVIYYLSDLDKNNSLHWISRQLEENGIALISGWSPGGDYLNYDEFRRLVKRYFRIEFEQELAESQHAVFVVRRKGIYVAITIDYETWQPIPEGKEIDWDNDIFRPAEKLLDICGSLGARVTFMAEMGEYFWLKENQPEVAEKMGDQWRKFIRLGHDVQLHLHPSWLPELGAKFENAKWFWDVTKAKAEDYPFDLVQLVRKCKLELESILQTENPLYKVTSFRAGAYQVQPFKRLHEALVNNSIVCDSSVYSGGYSVERGYDFNISYSDHNPYYANPYDPQLKAPPSEQNLIEIPVFTYKKNQRWFVDGDGGLKFAEQLQSYWNRLYEIDISTELYRKKNLRKRLLAKCYFMLKPYHRLINKILPAPIMHSITNYGPEEIVKDEYFVMIGHTKADHNFKGIKENLRQLKNNTSISFVTLSEMVQLAQVDLKGNAYHHDSAEEANFQVKREYKAIMGDERNEAQAFFLQNLIPLDRYSVLDLGCGAGYWTDRIAVIFPWMTVTGVDWGEEFIRKAMDSYTSKRISFLKEDFSNLSFVSKSFDCVYADNTLEHAFDVDKTLKEVFRVLKKGGVLVAAIPSDGYNPRMICDNHTWKTAPHEVKMRLENAGFVDIDIFEIDTFRQLGMAPYPPSDDKMMYIRAWKRNKPVTKLERCIEAMDWVYHHLSPEKSADSNDPDKILEAGFAWCAEYMVALSAVLMRENISLKWVTMFAKDHLRGRGVKKIETHNVVIVEIDGKESIFDPMANTHIPYSLKSVLANPSYAKKKDEPDSRYVDRHYCLYDTEYWYCRVYKYEIHRKKVLSVKELSKKYTSIGG